MIFPNPFQEGCSMAGDIASGVKKASAGAAYAFVQGPKRAAEAVGFWIGQAVGLFGLNESLPLERREEEVIIAGTELQRMGITPRQQHASRMHYKGARLTDEFIDLVIKENPELHQLTNRWIEHKLRQMQIASELGTHEACLDEKVCFGPNHANVEDRGVHLARVVFFHGKVLQHTMVDLTAEDVAKAVEDMGTMYMPYAKKLRELGINGRLLQKVDEKKLSEILTRDIGVTEETHLMMLLCELNKIRDEERKKPVNTCDIGIFILEHRLQAEVDGWFFSAAKVNMEEAKVCMNKIMGFHCWKQLNQETGDPSGGWGAAPTGTMAPHVHYASTGEAGPYMSPRGSSR